MRSKTTRFRIRCARELTGLVLDIGAGEGDYTDYLGCGSRAGGPCINGSSPSGACTGNVVRLDTDIPCLKQIPGWKIAAGANQLPFPDNTFDGVCFCVSA